MKRQATVAQLDRSGGASTQSGDCRNGRKTQVSWVESSARVGPHIGPRHPPDDETPLAERGLGVPPRGFELAQERPDFGSWTGFPRCGAGFGKFGTPLETAE